LRIFSFVLFAVNKTSKIKNRHSLFLIFFQFQRHFKEYFIFKLRFFSLRPLRIFSFVFFAVNKTSKIKNRHSLFLNHFFFNSRDIPFIEFP